MNKKVILALLFAAVVVVGVVASCAKAKSEFDKGKADGEALCKCVTTAIDDPIYAEWNCDTKFKEIKEKAEHNTQYAAGLGFAKCGETSVWEWITKQGQ